MAGISRKKKDIGIEKANLFKNISYHIIYILRFAFFVLAIIIILFILKKGNSNSYETLWTTRFINDSDDENVKKVNYIKYLDGIARLSSDGLTYVNGNGEIVYTFTYNVKNLICAANDKYLVVAEKNLNDFYIFDKNGLLFKDTLKTKINKFSLPNNNFIYFLLDDGYESKVIIYDIDNKSYKELITTSLKTRGIINDIFCNSFGDTFSTINTCLNNTSIYSKVSLYNGNINKCDIIEELVDKYVVSGKFLDNRHIILTYDGGVIPIEIGDNFIVKVLKEYKPYGNIKSLAYGNMFMALYLTNNKLISIDLYGRVKFQKNLDESFENCYIDSNYIILTNDNRAIIYNSNGFKIFDKELENKVQYVYKKKSTLSKELFLCFSDSVSAIRLH